MFCSHGFWDCHYVYTGQKGCIRTSSKRLLCLYPTRRSPIPGQRCWKRFKCVGEKSGDMRLAPIRGLRVYLAGMSRPGKAAWVTGAYISLAGLALMLAPLTCFQIFFNPEGASKGWIRVGGMLASLFGFYYLGAAHGDWASGGGAAAVRALEGFYLATVVGRVTLFVVFVAIVAAKEVGVGLLLPAVANLLGAASMWFALRAQLRSQEKP
eukprot:jgi/Botrbrau1/7189/Bobra.0300s0019.1